MSAETTSSFRLSRFCAQTHNHGPSPGRCRPDDETRAHAARPRFSSSITTPGGAPTCTQRGRAACVGRSAAAEFYDEATDTFASRQKAVVVRRGLAKWRRVAAPRGRFSDDLAIQLAGARSRRAARAWRPCVGGHVCRRRRRCSWPRRYTRSSLASTL